MNFIASPELVTAFAAAGRLSFNPLTDTLTAADGTEFKLEPPQPAPEVPASGFDRGSATCVMPPEDGRAIDLAIDPTVRAAALSPVAKRQPLPLTAGEVQTAQGVSASVGAAAAPPRGRANRCQAR
jgi:hypothetical protein